MTQVISEGCCSVLFRQFLKNLCHANSGILHRSSHVFQGVPGGGLEYGPLNVLV